MLNNTIFIQVLLSILGFVGAMMVKTLIQISKTLTDIKINFEVLNTKHDYLDSRVKDLETQNKNNNL